MDILADECIPAPLTEALREDGHDVAQVGGGPDDSLVLTRAVRERRVLLTEDRDFGRLVYFHREPAPVDVLYLRLGDAPLAEVVEIVREAFQAPSLLLGHFTTVGGRGVLRRRPLP